MVNLYVSFYKETNVFRNLELTYCLQKNIENRLIDQIYILLQGDVDLTLLSHPKVKVIQVESRPKYSKFFDIINTMSHIYDINIIANTDIFLCQQSVSEILRRLGSNDAYCLTRWDITNTMDNSTKFLDRRDSQDTWIIKGKPRIIESDFFLGWPGCDNRLAYELQAAGYNVSNPSKTIKTHHLHLSGVLNYDKAKGDLVPQPYKYLHPTI